uniref:Secreted protein n=1 Tax=Knipowitschia caucasica TaxID=637954 RepID=A0AAV2JCC2_KNICA
MLTLRQYGAGLAAVAGYFCLCFVEKAGLHTGRCLETHSPLSLTDRSRSIAQDVWKNNKRRCGRDEGDIRQNRS